MPYGYAGKVLRINLTNRETIVEKPDDVFYRTYVGGKGFIAYYLLNEVEENVDPLGTENKLIFATGIMTGLPVVGMPRYVVGAKSPLTDGFGQSEAGGFWGPELKKAGYDALILEGKSDTPVYIVINDDEIEIREASHLWGRETGEVQDMILDDLNDKSFKVAQIGPAGEKLVKYACISNNLKHYNGRNGLGAVMGSKNLRAIAVKGTKKLEFADKDKITKISKNYLSTYMEKPLSRGLHDFGTAGGVATLNTLGMLPTRNYKYGEFEGADKITGQKLAETILSKREGCYACAIRCKRIVDVDEEGMRIDPRYGGPEYETIAGFGSLCCIDDLKSISKANEMCNRLGIDTISTSVSIAFAMECYEKGLLSDEEIDGMDMSFGNVETMLKLIELIARREGIGNLLAEGSYRAAKKIGKGSESFLMTSKKQEFALHDPRTKAGHGLSYATAGNATDHMYMIHDNMISQEGEVLSGIASLGILEPIPAKDISWKKVRAFKTLSEWTSFINMAGICLLAVAPRGTLSMNEVAELYCAATGWNSSLYEIMKSGERSINMAKIFNLKNGLDEKDDKLSKKSFSLMDNECSPKHEIDKDSLYESIELLYEMRGWTDGKPSRGKLYELNLGWLVND